MKFQYIPVHKWVKFQSLQYTSEKVYLFQYIFQYIFFSSTSSTFQYIPVRVATLIFSLPAWRGVNYRISIALVLHVPDLQNQKFERHEVED